MYIIANGRSPFVGRPLRLHRASPFSPCAGFCRLVCSCVCCLFTDILLPASAFASPGRPIAWRRQAGSAACQPRSCRATPSLATEYGELRDPETRRAAVTVATTARETHRPHRSFTHLAALWLVSDLSGRHNWTLQALLRPAERGGGEESEWVHGGGGLEENWEWVVLGVCRGAE